MIVHCYLPTEAHHGSQVAAKQALSLSLCVSNLAADMNHSPLALLCTPTVQAS